MAIYRPGSIVGAVSGDVGGVSFANPSGSSVLRKKRRRTAAPSPTKARNQAYFQLYVKEWQAMSDAQRTTWRAFAANITRPNRLGVQRSISGFQEFMRVNLSIFPDTFNPILEPPIGVNPQQWEFFPIISDIIDGIILPTILALPAGSSTIQFYGSILWRNTIPKFNRDWTYIGESAGILGVYNVTTLWEAVMPLPVVGQVIALRAVPVGIPDLVARAPVDQFTITTA